MGVMTTCAGRLLLNGGINRGLSFRIFAIFQKAGEWGGSCSTLLAKLVLRISATRSEMMGERLAACRFNS